MATKTKTKVTTNGKQPAEDEQINLVSLNIQTVLIPIEGTTELIMHAWSEKAKRMMLDQQTGRARPKQEPKNPQEDYESAFYRMPNGQPAMPGGAFKAAIVGAARQFERKSVPMTLLKVALRVDADWIPIEGEPRMREDMVRINNGSTADIRYRPGFPEWKAVLPITVNANAVTLEQLVNLVNAAGMGGVGDGRPSSPHSASGTFGCFEISGEIQQLRRKS